MPRVSQQSIERIKRDVDFVDLVSPYTTLKRSGRDWKGLSPFSQEKTPSFIVHPERGFFKCFSSGKGGDQISFIREVENLEFIEAIEFIARKFNIQLEYESGGPTGADVSLRRQLFEIHDWAAEWFHRALMEGDESAPVRDYWQTVRGFPMEVAVRHHIGYAPAAGEALVRHLTGRGAREEALAESGLFFNRRSTSADLRARFRGRLMIPIRDVQGRVVAFTARQLGQTPEDDPAHQAKYVNSPETRIFQKGRILFGLDHARTHIGDGGGFLMVEGQLDAVRCWTAGLDTTVAPQGTAITEEHLGLLARYEPRQVECLLDGDEAGRKAALRILPMVLRSGLEFRFLPLPEGSDPDDLVRESGAAAIESLRAGARSPLELLIESQLPADRRPSPAEKNAALEQVFQHIGGIGSEVARDEHVIEAARILDIGPNAALKDFHRHRSHEGRSRRPAPDPAPAGAGAESALLTGVECQLLSLLLHFPEYGTAVCGLLDDDWIDTAEQSGRLLAALVADFREGVFEGTHQLEHVFQSDDDRHLLVEILSREPDADQARASIEHCLNRLSRSHLKNRLNELDQQLAAVEPRSREELEILKRRKLYRSRLRESIALGTDP